MFAGSSADGAGMLAGHFLPRITLTSLPATDIEAPGVATFNSEICRIDQAYRHTCAEILR